uniref:Putative secreted protein n=1 Tax=Ixodes ricinus TaxID=34613 RepID=A0A6B0UAP1_IXORI
MPRDAKIMTRCLLIHFVKTVVHATEVPFYDRMVLRWCHPLSVICSAAGPVGILAHPSGSVGRKRRTNVDSGSN